MPLTPASPFAALLRRSKFASLDTSIAQVYTSSGGDLSRGNWGLKRPLPLRRKGAHITVHAVDSKEQQTEWDPADQQGRWIKMWEEVAVTPELSEGPWMRRLGSKVNMTEEPFDSEYGKHARTVEASEQWAEIPDAKEVQPEQLLTEEERVANEERKAMVRMLEPGPGASMPNIFAMSDKQFEKYLEKVRQMRPAFNAYRSLVAEAGRREVQESAWQDIPADHRSGLYKTFLSKNAQHDLASPESRVIEQQPQQVAGIKYTRSSLVQSRLLTKPQHGRVLTQSTRARDGALQKGMENRASFAGMYSFMADDKSRGPTQRVEWRKLIASMPYNPGREAGRFRIIQAVLRKAPTVVGEAGRMEDVGLETHIKVVTESDLAPHKQPGTQAYSGWTGKGKSKSMTFSKATPGSIPAPAPPRFLTSRVQLTQPTSADDVSASSVLNTLQGLIVKDVEQGKGA